MKKERKKHIYVCMYVSLYIFVFAGMGKEVENLIMENNELLATKYVFHWISL
jgi:hypothetical protein